MILLIMRKKRKQIKLQICWMSAGNALGTYFENWRARGQTHCR
jgi:hypothetical protein